MTNQRIASSPQLWRLNQQGRISIVAEAVPITATEAHNLLAELAAGRSFNPTERFVELDQAEQA